MQVFLQTNWAIMGDEVCGAILDILNSSVMPPDLNLTHIALIPKNKNPQSVTEFRPISLYNVLYKLISKVLANRMKKIIPHIIAPTLSAFIPGRLITDNVWAAYETLHMMHTRMKGKKGFMAVKLDMSKAYDKVELRFLEAVMKHMGFNVRWISLIMMCVKSVHYSILVNGTPCWHITPSRGLRQGDPISPYLFLICAEALSSMVIQANVENKLTGVPTSKRGPSISHLFFADDSLLFCRSSVSQWNHLSAILQQYELASGQKMNSNKTNIFFSKNTQDADKEEIKRVAGIPTTQRYDTYLGLPALVGRSRMGAFKRISERVWKRLQDWKLKFLSQAGKEILLKAVIQAIPTYCMSIFMLPKALSKEINTLMQKFFWGHKDKEKRIHWMSWSKMGRSKANGGMGFRDFTCFNKALLAKQVWRLWKTPDSLIARIVEAKYYPRGSVLEAQLGKYPSVAWRSIHSSIELVREGLIWRIGNGRKARIWEDMWLPTPSTYKVYSPPSLLNPNSTVSSLINEDSKWWKRDLLEKIFTREETSTILSIPISQTNREDKLIWRGTAKGVFLVRSAYHILKECEEAKLAAGSGRENHSFFWKKLWQLHIPNAEKNFLWRACQDILPTKVNLCQRKVCVENWCPICEQEEETTLHILWHCPSARDAWGAGSVKFQKAVFDGPDFMKVVEGMFERCDENEFQIFVGIARRLWLRRNEVVHGGRFVHPNVVVQQTITAVRNYQEIVAKGQQHGVINSLDSSGKWQAPPPGWVKANWDASVDIKSGKVGLGAVVRDSLGNLHAAQTRSIPGLWDPTSAEALAALMAAKLCQEMGWSHIQLEGDAKALIEAVKSMESDESRRGHLTEDIRTSMLQFSSSEVKYVRRQENQVAHAFVRLALNSNLDEKWRSDPPECIRAIIEAEQSAL
jgi:ribonuclease HI